ncbi:MDR family MFS transporter [Galactobacter sp.]|uniref:MDR family MFS transporter n=1 Tax=Galactobacter sp. TaxID=2676125 RepID=UPI0025C2D02F|nr:MDR family MFS transporter [Galactobacter sp.]
MSKTKEAPAVPAGLHMTHGQVLRALTGLLLGMFVTMIANTLVSTSMPKIITDLDGELNQTSYSWVLVATMLATAISTPIWGKLSDLTNRKVLLQISLILFVGASAVAGFSESSMMLIICRVFQGLGAGGMQALSQIVMADILSPRERGKYMGLFAGVMAIATVGGPLIGGWITDAFSWHWNFFLSLPFAVVAVIMLQKTLHLPPVEKQEKARLDWLGTVLLTGGMSLALIWLSLAGTSAQVDSGSKQIEYGSFTTVWMLAVAAVALIVFVFVELKVADPLLDMRLFKNLTFTMSTVGSIAVGVAMFGCVVYLSQLMIMSRGATPSEAGLMTIPMMLGMMGISVVVGGLITKTGVWKPYMIAGGVLLIAGLYLISTTDENTNYWLLAAWMFVMGAGVGMIMQNLTLVVQNAVPPKDLGVATSAVSFFRTLGGTVGTTWLGSVLASKLPDVLADHQDKLGAAAAKAVAPKVIAEHPELAQDPQGLQAYFGAHPELIQGYMAQVSQPASNGFAKTAEPFKSIFEGAYADSITHLFLIAAPIAIITLICIIFLPKLDLSDQTRSERTASEKAAFTVEHEPIATGAVPVVTGATNLVPDAGARQGARGTQGVVETGGADGAQSDATTSDIEGDEGDQQSHGRHL